MACGTQDANVRASQAELSRVVIESRPLPARCVVAPAAIVRKARGYVIRVGRGCKRLRMATVAVCRKALVPVVGVTGRARQLRVRAG